jgi:hypothetical protein
MADREIIGGSDKAPITNEEVNQGDEGVQVRDFEASPPAAAQRTDGGVSGTPTPKPRVPQMPAFRPGDDAPTLAEFAITLCPNRIAHQKPTGIMCDTCRPFFDHQNMLVAETKRVCIEAVKGVKGFLADEHDKMICESVINTLQSTEPFIAEKKKIVAS